MRIVQEGTKIISFGKENMTHKIIAHGVYEDYLYVKIYLYKVKNRFYAALLNSKRRNMLIRLSEVEYRMVTHAIKNMGLGIHTIMDIYEMLKRMGTIIVTPKK